MATVPGIVAERFNQLGIQSVIGTAVAATRKVPWRGIPTYNPNRTYPDIDEGSIDHIVRPYAMAVDVDWNPTGPLDFDNALIRMSAGLKGGVAGSTSGTATTWTYQTASLTQDDFDYYSLQSGDDTEATDSINAFGGVIDVLEETGPEDGGPVTINDQWIFAGATLGANATDSIVIDEDPVWAFATDTRLYMDTVAGSIGITPIIDGLHGWVYRISNNLDRKRLHNGSNTRFQLSGYGRGKRLVEIILTFAKTSAVVTEAATLDDTPVVNRYFKLSTTSTELAAAAAPFRYERFVPARLFERADVEVGGNAAIQLTYRGFYDSTLGYAIRHQLVNQLAAKP